MEHRAIYFVKIYFIGVRGVPLRETDHGKADLADRSPVRPIAHQGVKAHLIRCGAENVLAT